MYHTYIAVISPVTVSITSSFFGTLTAAETSKADLEWTVAVSVFEAHKSTSLIGTDLSWTTLS